MMEGYLVSTDFKLVGYVSKWTAKMLLYHIHLSVDLVIQVLLIRRCLNRCWHYMKSRDLQIYNMEQNNGKKFM